MLVTFVSSEAGEFMAFADVAGQILRACGKPTTARGAFTVDEMPAAAERLRQAIARGEAGAAPAEESEDGPPVTLSSRAWPFIEMLERTARGGPKANIVWTAAADF